ncbi:hypothetical protein E1B28_000200 [Marasmius oreades]|uniref:Protein kinase domain-containing protein n=1 Tax=Marasmius oreades TaxID=181124 RepID=A0A9P7V0Y4_9AGAR|nr:uncharacterized protein E1B28_000200 [Marasmius oreades]KAG7098236.1 hypothetical protein E1B28_000200 [Marasmius oreades]
MKRTGSAMVSDCSESKRIPGTRRQALEESIPSAPRQYGLLFQSFSGVSQAVDALTQINCSMALTYRGSPRSRLANWLLFQPYLIRSTVDLVMEDLRSKTATTRETIGKMHANQKDTSARKKAHADEIIRIVTDVQNHEQRNQLFRKRGQDAQIWLNSLQAAAELPEISTELRSSIFKIMLKLSKHSDVTPECLNIKNVTREGEHPIGAGGFGDVWKGKVRQTIVCLKVVRNFQQGNESNSQDLLKQFKREAILWKQLESHPNILPFFGMYDWDGAPGKLCLVSPWMEGGNLAHYLNPRPPKMKPVVDHTTLVTLAYDVASGLEYLHDRKIVHGDLKGVNILIRTLKPLRACIGDFGLSRVSDDHAISLSTTSQSRVEGTLRWLAPELLLDPSCRLSKELQQDEVS